MVCTNSLTLHPCHMDRKKPITTLPLVGSGISLHTAWDATLRSCIRSLFDAPLWGGRCTGPLLSPLATQLIVQNPGCLCRSPLQPVNVTICIVHSIPYHNNKTLMTRLWNLFESAFQSVCKHVCVCGACEVGGGGGSCYCFVLKQNVGRISSPYFSIRQREGV